MSFLEWRRLNFFDLKKNIDEGKLAEALKDTTIEVCTSGNSRLVIGDSTGWVRLISRAWGVIAFKAYELNISLAVQLKHDPCLITIGEDEPGVNPIIKVWDSARQDRQGNPLCVRIARAVPSHLQPTAATVLAVHDNKNLMAVGFQDGSVSLFRGDITKQRSSKMKTLPDCKNSGITGLAFKGTSHLFVTSRLYAMMYNIASTGKERCTILEVKPILGCNLNCTIMADQQFVVARDDALYCYTTDGKGPSYALGGNKQLVGWFRSYLLTISKDFKSEGPASYHINILDIQSKIMAFCTELEEVKAIITEWGGFYIITHDKQVHHLDEKDLQSKLSLLFKKNLYDVAIKIASSQQYDTEGLIDIYTQYGDHLYTKGDPKGAIEQYVKTIGRLETSYVIRKYLQSRHLEPLTVYLQALHRRGLATEDHTTLLLTCFIKLDQHDHQGKLKNFISANDRVIDFDVEIAIKVCRQVSTDDALHLAKKHNQHDWYLRIITEDKKDFLAALDYIADLEFDDADLFMKKYGNVLVQHVPEECIAFLIILCTDYMPRNKPLVDDAMMAGTIARNRCERARPADYLHLFLDQSVRLVAFLERLNWRQSPALAGTLLEHRLLIWAERPPGPAREAAAASAMRLLQDPEAVYDKDQTLIVCQMLNFKSGILFLYEERKLYQQILRYHIAQDDMDSAMSCCRRFGAQEPSLWVEMLWCPPPPNHRQEVLNVISNQRLLSPLLVIDCLSSSTAATLGDIRKYLMDVLVAENSVLVAEKASAERHRADTEAGREALTLAATTPTTCQASRCTACTRPLDLPARYFLCTHGYHIHCFQSFSESENECPACVLNNQKLLQVLRSQGASAQTTETFHDQLERAYDGFTVVAEYFGRGVFNKLTVIDGPAEAAPAPPPPAAPRGDPFARPDTLTYGPGAEARIRLEEGARYALSTESQKPPPSKSAILIPASEGRMRLMEQRQRETQYSSSLEANLNHFPAETSSAALGTRTVQAVRPAPRSAQAPPPDNNNSAIKPAPSGPKNDKIEITKQAGTSGNPFDEDDKNPFQDDEEDEDPSNPFSSKAENYYDSALDPFA